MKFFNFFIVILFFLDFNFYGQNSIRNIEYGLPATQKFNANDYGGEAQNLGFIQDDKGQLIIANTFGFLVFDGINWKKFKPDNEGLPISFAQGSSNKIYTGGTEFIGYLNPSKRGGYSFVDLTKELPKGVNVGFVWNTFSKNKTIYFENTDNVIAYKNNKFQILEDNSKVNNLFKFEDELFVSTKKGFYKIKGNNLIEYPEFKEIRGYTVKNLYRISKNKKLIITRKNGLYLLQDSKITSVKSPLSSFLKKNIVMKFEVLSDNNIAIGTSKKGLLFLDKSLKPILRLNQKTGLTHDNVRSFYQDLNNNLWIACQSGITKINYPINATFYDNNSESIGTVEEISRFKNDIYIGTGTGTYKLNSISNLDILTDNFYTNFTKIDGSDIFNFANYVLSDKLFFGSQSGTRVFDGSSSKRIDNKEARKFYKSKFHNNVVFMGHKLGCNILFYDKNSNIINSKPIQEISNQIRGIAEDKYGNLWLSTISNGVFKIVLDKDFNVSNLQHYTLKDGLPSLRDVLVYNVKDDLIFTTQRGLYQFDYNKNTFIPSSYFGNEFKGGVNDFIYAFNFDAKENAWLHSFRKKTSVLAYKSNEGNYKLNKEMFVDINNRAIYDIFSEPDKNSSWFCGADGITRLKYHTVNNKKKEVKSIISKITAGDSIIINGPYFDKNSKISLSQNFKDFKFQVGSSNFQNTNKNKFQYFLEGYDKEWSDWTSETFKVYTNLDHNNYEFLVRTKNVYGSISKTENFSFQILPYWYQKTWARALFFLVFVLIIVYLTSYFSERKFIKKTHELEIKQQYENEKNQAIISEQQKSLQAVIQAEENERFRIARELHDGVVQQIGSVILKSRNVLKDLNVLDKQESQDLIKNLEDSNQDLRNISHQMMPRALNELGVVSAIEDLLQNSLGQIEIKYSFEHFNISERLPQKVEVTIYRVCQELVNNIIKHSKANEVSVQLFKTGNNLVFIVEDDGVGMPNKQSKKGIGLLNISSRLDMVNGDVNFEPSPQSGTLVTIKIPV